MAIKKEIQRNTTEEKTKKNKDYLTQNQIKYCG